MKHSYYLRKVQIAMPINLVLLLVFFATLSSAQQLSYADRSDEAQKLLSSTADVGRSLENGQVYTRSYSERRGESKLRKSFRVKISKDGTYHLVVHLLATREVPLSNTVSEKLYPLQQVRVYLDDQDLGPLSIQKEGWHVTGLESDKALPLAAGEHLVVFEAAAPFYPEIDVIKLALNKEDAKLDTSHYGKYIESLIANMEKNKGNTSKLEFTEPEKRESGSPNARVASAVNKTTSWEVSPYTLSNPLGLYKHTMTLPVVYTYYRKLYLTSGQNVVFHTTPISGNDYYTVDPVMYLFCDANKNHAWSNDDHTGRHPRIQITVPQTGDYYLVLRAYSSYYASAPTGSQGIVDVWQNGSSLNTNMPVSGYMLDVSTSESGTLNYFTGFSTGIPKIWIAEAGTLSPLRYHGSSYWYAPPMTYNWFNDARLRLIKSGSGSMDLKMLVSSEGAWYVYWGNADAYGSVSQAGSALDPSYFPNLHANDAMRTAPASNSYNCTSWAGGRTDLGRYFWASNSPAGDNLSSPWYVSGNFYQSWDNYYGNSPARFVGAPNYTRTDANSSNGEIAMWGPSSYEWTFTHASLRWESNRMPHGYDWESKPGGNERIFHPRDALNNPNGYGSIQFYYRDASKSPYLRVNNVEESVALGLTVLPRVVLEADEEKKLNDLLSTSTLQADLFRERLQKLADLANSKPYVFQSTFDELGKSDTYKEFAELCVSNPQYNYLLAKTAFDNSTDTFLQELAEIVFVKLTRQKYAYIMDEVKADWQKNHFTKMGEYIAPSSRANAKNYIKKVLALSESKRESGIEDNSENFVVAPNPAITYSKLNFVLKEPVAVTISITDASGANILTPIRNQVLDAGQRSIEINTSNWKVGIYIVTFASGNKVYTRKLMVGK